MQPLAADFDESIKIGAQLVFSSFATLDANAGFIQARDRTADVAELMYGKAARLSVEQAWHAVGVGPGQKPAVIDPLDGATDVDPWSTTVRWEVGAQAGPWKLRYSKASDFASATEVTLNSAVAVPGTRVVETALNLDPGTKYYWQARDASLSDGWDCETFAASFTTSQKTPRLRIPELTTSNAGATDYYKTDYEGLVALEIVKGADAYDVRLAEVDDKCDPNKVWTGFFADPLFYLGNTLEPDRSLRGRLQQLLADMGTSSTAGPNLLEPTLDLAEDTTYHLYIRARHDQSTGACAHFPVRKTRLLPFAIVNGGALSYGGGGPFVWTPSAGADHYKLELAGFGGPVLAQETLQAQGAVLDANGNVSYVLANKEATTALGTLVLTVHAVHANGQERVRTPGFVHPGSEISAGSYFTAAAPFTTSVTENGMNGTSAPTMPTQVSVVLSPSQTMFDTITCFDLPENTIGMQWWVGGPTESPPELGRFPHTVMVQGSDRHLCTDRYLLGESSGGTKRLLAASFSRLNARLLGVAEGFAPVTELLVTASPCGNKDGVCCPNLLCNPGANCDGNTCKECGSFGQECCGESGSPSSPKRLCGDPTQLICFYPGSDSSICRACGGVGQICCGGPTTLKDPRINSSYDGVGSYSYPGTCRDPYPSSVRDAKCVIDPHGSLGRCESCGDLQETCCALRDCIVGASCISGPGSTVDHSGNINHIDYNGNTCKPSTVAAPPSTPAPQKCAEAVPSHGFASEIIPIEMGRSSGTVTLTMDTFVVPDQIRILQDGNLVYDALCLGTALAPVPMCYSDGWCCAGVNTDGGNECSRTLRFSGASTKLVAEVNANCAGAGETQWRFKLSCPE